MTGISLPDFAECIFLKGFAVTHVWISGRFQVILFNKALDGADTDCFRNKRVSTLYLQWYLPFSFYAVGTLVFQVPGARSKAFE